MNFFLNCYNRSNFIHQSKHKKWIYTHVYFTSLFIKVYMALKTAEKSDTTNFTALARHRALTENVPTALPWRTTSSGRQKKQTNANYRHRGLIPVLDFHVSVRCVRFCNIRTFKTFFYVPLVHGISSLDFTSVF